MVEDRSRSPRASATGARARSRGSTAGRSRRSRPRQLDAGEPAPSPAQADASTTRRSVDLEQVVARAPTRSGGSPGHQTVTGRSWMSSGATSADRCRPVSPPAVRKISSVHVSGASAPRQHAVGLDPRVHPRRPVRVRGLDDQRPRRMPAGQPADRLGASARRPRAGARRRPGSSPTSGPRCAGRRASALAVPVGVDDREVRLRPDPGQLAARCPRSSAPVDIQRSVGSPGRGGSASAICPPPAGRVPTAMISPGTRSRSAPPVEGPRPRRRRSDPAPPSSLAREQVVGGLGPPGARLVVREVGRRATRPRRRGSGPRSTTPPPPRRRG